MARGTVALGPRTLFAVRSNGALWGMGNNESGQLGDGTANERHAPVRVIASGVASVSTSMSHTMVVKDDHSLWGMGENQCGELGDGTTEERHAPVKIMDGVRSCSAGYSDSLVIKEDNTLWGMGENRCGELGDGTAKERHTPVKIMNGVRSCSAGGNQFLVIKEDGSLWGMGSNECGVLGLGLEYEIITEPVKIMDGVRSCSAGLDYSLVIKEDGSLWGMGNNQYGQLGDGTTEVRHAPVKIMDGVRSCSAGKAHSLVTKDDDTLWGMGHNGACALGAGPEVVTQPVKISVGVELALAARRASLVLKRDGSLWGMGTDASGNLGLGVGQCFDTPQELALGNIPVPKGTKRKRKSDPNHCQSMMMDMWENRKFPDASICCGASVFAVHRSILSAASPVLARMFQTTMSEGTECKIEIRGGASAGAVEGMIAYAYTGSPPELSLTAEVLHLSNQYELPGLGKLCADALLQGMDAENATLVLQSMWLLRDLEHLQIVWQRVVEKFSKLFSSKPELQEKVINIFVAEAAHAQ